MVLINSEDDRHRSGAEIDETVNRPRGKGTEVRCHLPQCDFIIEASSSSGQRTTDFRRRTGTVEEIVVNLILEPEI